MSTPETDRVKRKAALNEARQKLALRKKQREELRAQRAARLDGKIDTISSFTSSSSSAANASSISGINKRSSIKKQVSLLAFVDELEDDSKDPLISSSKAPNKASLLRSPGKRRTLSMGRLSDYNYFAEKNVITWDKGTDTSFDMFGKYLMEQFDEEFPNKQSITNEVKANLIISKYKIGWPKELWMHEKSLSPSPENIMYADDDEEYIQQQQKMALIAKQEKERKQRQFEMIQQRRKLKLEKKNRLILPEQEANILITTGTFLENFRKKAKWMERTIGINTTTNLMDDIGDIYNQYDVYDDVDDNKYTEDDDIKDNMSMSTSTSTTKKPVKQRRKNSILMKKRNNLLKYVNKFKTAETEGRAIGDINFSLTNTDWFCASYLSKSGQENNFSFDNDGHILIWNLLLPSFPEYTLYSQSMITSTHFHPTDNFLVFAATTSGQILCYDLRTGSNSKPVQRTTFSDGHSSAIFSMDFLQSAAGSKTDRRHILSVSNDGKLCIWKDDALNEKPMHEGILKLYDNTTNITEEEQKASSTSTSTGASGSSSSQELSTTCFGYQYKHSDHVFFGSDSGKVYRTDIHNNSKNTEGDIYVEQCIDAHYGPITNIDFAKYHQNQANTNKISTNTSGLYLTSSYDWSVKLWHSDYTQCIETYTSMTDYVYDVKWCNGGKPGVFVCCDGESKLTLFDLKYDFKEPISNPISVPVENKENGVALTKLQWGNNGRYLASGDSNGTIYLYITSNSLLHPKQSDFDNLEKTVMSTVKSRGYTKQSK